MSISASFVTSLLVGYLKVYAGRRGADVVMSSPTGVNTNYDPGAFPGNLKNSMPCDHEKACQQQHFMKDWQAER
jgi:hypothetical protein